jgi:oligopeptide/dipeptide ABC transporter ATP-binding protein
LRKAGAVLEVSDATVEFRVAGGTIRALDGVSVQLGIGETVAIVGESGCGKTTLARCVLGLEPLKKGRIELHGDVVRRTWKGMGERVGMVWQDPFASLDPRWSVGRSVLEPARLSGREVDLEKTFEEVGLDPGFKDRFPHQLSGGQRQRVAIARAIALKPGLLICDEPTAALDLSVRAQILNVLKGIQADLGCSILYISHDLVTVRYISDRVAVMYLGRIVESGPTEAVFENPRHPYTRALLDCAPSLEELQRLPDAIYGEIPDPRTRLPGCRFAPRCVKAQKDCLNSPAETKDGNRAFECFFPLADGEALQQPQAETSLT